MLSEPPVSPVIYTLSQSIADNPADSHRLPAYIDDLWTLQIRLSGRPASGQVLVVSKDPDSNNIRNTRILAVVDANEWSASVYFDSHPAPLILRAKLDLFVADPANDVVLVNGGSVLSLLINGQLADEEWPIGNCTLANAVLDAADSVQDVIVTCMDSKLRESNQSDPTKLFSGSLQYWKPDEALRVGDCMPFADQGTFHLFYLQDRHGHKSKWGLGAHQWAHLASDNLKNWISCPMAIPISEQWEGSICTGSVICENGLWYAFYALRMSDGSPAQLSWSVSDDGIHFKKSGCTFTLSEPYEPVSARDPLVFKDDAGLYHMLVTTSLTRPVDKSETLPMNPGCLAHLVSSNLHDWQQREPFLVPGYSDQPECPDLFALNDWYYLLFSNYGAARYRKSRSPFGPWLKPAVDLIDGPAYRVPKTARFFAPDEKIITVGFLAEQAGEYAGCAVFRELYQKPNGDLASRFLEPVMPQPQDIPVRIPPFTVDGGSGCRSVDFPLPQDHFRLSFIVAPLQPFINYGILLDHAATQQGWELRFEPGHGKAGFHRRNERFYVEDERQSLYGLSNLDQPVQVDLVYQDRIFDLMINGERTMVLRLDKPDGGYSRLGFFAMAGAVEFSDIQLGDISISPDRR